MKFKNATHMRFLAEDFKRNEVKSAIKRTKKEISKAANDGLFLANVFYSSSNIAEEVYAKLAPELILKGYEVLPIIENDLLHIFKGLRISWRRPLGPYQIEENMCEYYKQLGELNKHEDNS